VDGHCVCDRTLCAGICCEATKQCVTDDAGQSICCAIDFNVVNQSFDEGGDTVVYGAYLYRYGSIESAAKRIRRQFDQTKPDQGFDHYETLDLGSFGDESIVTPETTADGSIAREAVTGRVGTIVVQVLVQAGSPPASTTLTRLMTAEIACIGNGGCTRPVAYPAQNRV
jgi:hypothetical protein